MIKVARAPTPLVSDFMEGWMLRLGSSYRKTLSYKGAIKARTPQDPVHWTDKTTRVNYFDPSNRIYQRAWCLAFPTLRRQYNWNRETVGDIYEALLGLWIDSEWLRARGFEYCNSSEAERVPNYTCFSPQGLMAAWIDELVYVVYEYTKLANDWHIDSDEWALSMYYN